MKCSVVLACLAYTLSSSLLGLTCQPNFINEVSGSPFSTQGNVPSSIAFTPNGEFVLIINGNSDNIGSFSVGLDGMLTPVNGSPFGLGTTPRGLCIHPNGKFAAVVDIIDDNIRVFSIVADGSLMEISGSPFNPVGLDIFECAYSPDGRFLAVSSDDTIEMFTVNQTTGRLTNLTQSPSLGDDPRKLAFNNDGTLIATATGTGIGMLQVAFDGTLTIVAGSLFGPVALPTGVVFTPDGNFLLSVYFTLNQLHIFAVAVDGTLTDVNTIATGADPRGIDVSPNGKLVANSNFDDANVDVYTINGSLLTKVPGSPFPTGTDPEELSFSPHTILLAVINQVIPGTVSVYCIQNSLKDCAKAIFDKYRAFCAVS